MMSKLTNCFLPNKMTYNDLLVLVTEEASRLAKPLVSGNKTRRLRGLKRINMAIY